MMPRADINCGNLLRRIRAGIAPGVSMGRNKSSANAKKLIWRINDAAPFGEFGYPHGAVAHGDGPEVSSGGWAVSSFELLHGTEITENPDAIPDALLDELFASHNSASTPSGRK